MMMENKNCCNIKLKVLPPPRFPAQGGVLNKIKELMQIPSLPP